jgi:hypothetical protein
MVKQAFGEDSMRCTQKVQTLRLKKARHVKSKLKGMLIIFLGIKGIFQPEFVLADKTVNSAYYCVPLQRVGENVIRRRPEIWRQKY